MCILCAHIENLLETNKRTKYIQVHNNPAGVDSINGNIKKDLVSHGRALCGIGDNDHRKQCHQDWKGAKVMKINLLDEYRLIKYKILYINMQHKLMPKQKMTYLD